MICQTCKSDCIRNEALGKEFYYCRSCKKEPEIETPAHSTTLSGHDFYSRVQTTDRSSSLVGTHIVIPVMLCSTQGTGGFPLVPPISTTAWYIPIPKSRTIKPYLRTWIPALDPNSKDSHFGVNRSSDIVRLSGTRYIVGASLEGTLVEACNNIGRAGGAVDSIYINPFDKKHFLFLNEIPHSYGRAIVYEDLSCPQGLVYCCQQDTWSYDNHLNILLCSGPSANGVIIL